VAEYPPEAGAPLGPGAALPGEVEVGPPGAEADHDGDKPEGEGHPADRLPGQAGHDTGEGLAEHDDGERPEPLGERVADDQRGRLYRGGRQDHGGVAGQVGDVKQAPGRNARAGRQQRGAG